MMRYTVVGFVIGVAAAAASGERVIRSCTQLFTSVSHAVMFHHLHPILSILS